MKRVVFYLSDFQSGGTEWFALRLARALALRGYTPLFLVVQKKGELISLIQREFDTTILNGSGYCLGRLLVTIPAMVRFLREKKPDALISGLPLLNAVAAMAISLSGVNCRMIAVEHMRLCRMGAGVGAMVRFYAKRLLTHWAHRRADRVVCVSKTVLEDICANVSGVKSSPILIYNPIIPANLTELMAEGTGHRWLDTPQEGPLIVAIGRLLPVKDFPTLLKAFRSILDKRVARLLILGEGEERTALEQMIQALHLGYHVSMPGTVRNVFPYLKAADVFVLSSTHEAFGNVIAEALACGTKIVSTDCGGPREILRNGALGELVRPSDPLALAKAVERALNASGDPAERMAAGRAFSVEAAAESYIKILEALA